jgi:eukaryotic-like serine/threonine-protein kinase
VRTVSEEAAATASAGHTEPVSVSLDTGGAAEETGEAGWTPLQLGPFTLSEVVGRGGMGLVWSGRHDASGLPVAIKVMTARQFRRPRARDALVNEIRAASVLCHPGIALLFDQGLVDPAAEAASDGRIVAGSPYVVMELVSGGTLGEQPPDRWSKLRRVLLELLSALAHAHARGLVHRDLKPSNVLVAAEGDLRSGVRLTDWGIARALMEDGGPDAGLGTVHYMAPEQILGQWRDQGPWTDLYSLGCLAFRMAAGRRAVAGDGPTIVARAHLEGRLEPFEPWMPLPAGFEGWLDGLLARDPDHRFQRAADAAHALLDLGEPDADLGPAEPPLEPFGLRAMTRRETLPGFVSERTPNALVDSSATSAFNIPALTSDEAHSADALAPDERPPSAPLAPDWRPEPGLPSLPLLVGVGLGLVGLRPPPMVGRHRLRDRLWRRMTEVVRTGRCGILLLSGEPGRGKTRLADWLVDRADELGAASTLRVAHHDTGGPGHGIIPALGRALVVQGLSPHAAAARVAEFCAARGAEDPTEGVALAELLRGDDSNPRAARLALICRALRRLCHGRPLALRLDDLQWGPESVDLLCALLEAPAMPMFVVATWRATGEGGGPESSERWSDLADHADFERIEVPPLPRHDLEALLDGLLQLEPTLRRAILERADGMPLFAVDLVADEVRRDRLIPGPDGWQLRDGEPGHLPDGLHTLWVDRVARALEGLHPDAAHILELAATLGQDIDERELRAVCAAADLKPVPQLLPRLRAHNLAEATPHGMRLAHALLRESLLRQAAESGQLAGWHGRCADALHRLHGSAEAEASERVGRHLRGAGRLQASLTPLLNAAERRRERGDYDRAMALLRERGRALERLGLGGERVAESTIVEARIAGNRGEFGRAADLSEAVAQDAAAHGWRRVEPEAMRTLAFAWWQQGRYTEAEAHYADALTRFEALEQPLGIARCEMGLGIAAYQAGQLAAAEARFERAERVFRDAGILRGVVDSLGWGGILCRRLGRNTEALQRFGDAVAAAESGGLRFACNAVRNSLGVTLRAMDRPDEAEVVFRAVLSEAELLGTGEAVWPCINLGLLRLAAGEPGRASSFLRRALRLLESTGRVTFEGGVRVALMACAAAVGEWENFGEQHDAARAALERAPLPHPDIARSAEHAAASARTAGRSAEERQALAIARDQWHGLKDADATARIDERLTSLS